MWVSLSLADVFETLEYTVDPFLKLIVQLQFVLDQSTSQMCVCVCVCV